MPLASSSTFSAPLAVLLLAAPVLEETVFRAGLQETLLRHLSPGTAGAAAANALTALVFMAAHLALRPGLLSALTAVPALALGALYQRRRRLVPCIALHALFNAVGLLSAAIPS
jgi:membrane protease YdiL (CAAX protease family)